MKSIKSKNSQAGFSLIETLVALSIMTCIMASMMKSVVTFQKSGNTSMVHTNSVFAAQKIMDELRFEDLSSMPMSGTQTRVVSVDGLDINVEITFCKLSPICSIEDTRHLQVASYYLGNKVYETQSIYTKFE